MRAVQFRTVSGGPEVVDVPVPEPGPGQVLLAMTAAGVCHSDLVVMGRTAAELRFPLPLTLGHEGTGVVAGTGPGVTAVSEGEAVAVHGAWGCGRCGPCAQGRENHCPYAAPRGILSPGLGAPGTMAAYMLVDDARHLVPLAGLDPVRAVSLTDAGLTPYHAIKALLPGLTPGATVVVIGVGGLGHVAIQLLRALTACRVIALDVSEEKRELAAEVGAHTVLHSGPGAERAVRELTDGLGARAVLDFAGTPASVALAGAVAAVDADICLIGIGGGSLPVGFGRLPLGVRVHVPYWGSRSELAEVLELGRSGAVRVRVETYPLTEAPKVYERLHHGSVRGRAVLLPDA
ncbi:NAD(P)-dependent alcohol dehydrogenase [Streptomyces sp. NPDC059766]|uniref:NAD(P)-dependent alcohol dehydrogenase n=1 Tax=Streptomyces sp. NPDC059766 TaxID=3346940 RepID=UPI00366580C9